MPCARLSCPSRQLLSARQYTVSYSFMFLGRAVRPFRYTVLLPQYLMNGLNSFNKTDREYSLAPY